MLDIKVKLNNKQVQNLLKKAPKITKEEMHTALKKSVIYASGEVSREAPTDRGRLKTSIKSKIQNSTGLVYPNNQYAKYVEFGRKPGKMPPVKALELWARRKGLNPYLVARRIKQKGVKANPFFKRGAEASVGKIQKFFKNALKNISKRMTK